MQPYVHSSTIHNSQDREETCISIGRWIKKMWYIYTMEYYAAIKKNAIMRFAATLTGLKIIMTNEMSQTDKDKYHMISLIFGDLKYDTNELYKTEIDNSIMYRMDRQQGPTVEHRELCSISCD